MSNLTAFDALVSMAQTVLRVRGDWQQGATAFTDIDRAVNNVADLMPLRMVSRDMCEAAIAEIKRRCGPPRVTPQEYAAMTAREAAQAGELTEAQAREIASHDRNYRARLMRGKWVVWCDASDHVVEF